MTTCDDINKTNRSCRQASGLVCRDLARLFAYATMYSIYLAPLKHKCHNNDSRGPQAIAKLQLNQADRQLAWQIPSDQVHFILLYALAHFAFHFTSILSEIIMFNCMILLVCADLLGQT